MTAITTANKQYSRRDLIKLAKGSGVKYYYKLCKAELCKQLGLDIIEHNNPILNNESNRNNPVSVKLINIATGEERLYLSMYRASQMTGFSINTIKYNLKNGGILFDDDKHIYKVLLHNNSLQKDDNLLQTNNDYDDYLLQTNNNNNIVSNINEQQMLNKQHELILKRENSFIKMVSELKHNKDDSDHIIKIIDNYLINLKFT